MREQDTTNRRKQEVIEILRTDPDADRRRHYFDALALRHRALPELALEEVDTAIEFMGKRLSFPLLISSMTGGDCDLLRTINRRLAEAAEATGVAMGVGSQRVMFTHPAARSSFTVREWAPTALVFANLGGVQLNYGFGLEHCQEAIRVTGADGLYFHLNPLQEAVQPEGNTNFAGLADRIGDIARSLDRPVLVKEVGAGLSLEDAQLLLKRGVRYFDVAGAGGTSWSRIEHHRTGASAAEGLGMLFQDWGLPTPIALWQLRSLRDHGAVLIASGGVRNGVDMVKAMALGASLCGMALPFLGPARQSTAAVVAAIERVRREFRTAMFLLGQRRADDLIGQTTLLRNTPC